MAAHAHAALHLSKIVPSYPMPIDEQDSRDPWSLFIGHVNDVCCQAASTLNNLSRGILAITIASPSACFWVDAGRWLALQVYHWPHACCILFLWSTYLKVACHALHVPSYRHSFWRGRLHDECCVDVNQCGLPGAQEHSTVKRSGKILPHPRSKDAVE